MKKPILIILLCTVLDQLHKFYMLEIYDIDSKGFVEITPFFNYVMVWNKGMSFGMLSGHENSNLFFMVFVPLILAFIFYLAKKSESQFEKISLSIIIGGAIGNLIDRIRFGAVADFFDFHISGFHWPAFNIADSCVFIGTVLFTVYIIFYSNQNQANKTELNSSENSTGLNKRD